MKLKFLLENFDQYVESFYGLNENLNEYVDYFKIIDDGFRQILEPIIEGLSVCVNSSNDVWGKPNKSERIRGCF